MAHVYNLKNVIASIGPVKLGGYGDDGGLEFEWMEALGEMSVGADGHTVYSFNNNNVLFCTITLKETSSAYTQLAALMQTHLTAIRAGTGNVVARTSPFQMNCPNTGDVVASGVVYFLQRPAQTKAKGVSERVFRIALPKPKTVFGAANILPEGI